MNDDGFMPPVFGDLAAKENRSPYRLTLNDFVVRFAVSKERIELLLGFLKYRIMLRETGIQDGLQWINGSFVEVAELTRGRAPSDIDCVTIVTALDNARQNDIQKLLSVEGKSNIKTNYLVDAYYMYINSMEPFLRDVLYWSGLFGHTKNSLRWKGFIEIELKDQNDAEFISTLQNLLLERVPNDETQT